MPVFTSKPSTNPGPFDALHPRPERTADRARGVDRVDTAPDGLIIVSQGQDVSYDQRDLHGSPTPDPDGVDEDPELEHLYRFQEIPVTAEMRRELLGAKLPLASVEQLADTQPPHRSSLSAPAGAMLVDRHAPTEPALLAAKRPRLSDHPPSGVNQSPAGSHSSREVGPSKLERRLLDGDSYSTSAPTLLSVRRRRLRNQRYVIAALAAMILAVMTGVVWRRSTLPPASLVRDGAASRVKSPHIAGNRPGSTAPPVGQEQRSARSSGKTDAESRNAQLSLRAADATSGAPRSADPTGRFSDPQRASTPLTAAPAPAAPSQRESRLLSASAPAAGTTESTGNAEGTGAAEVTGKPEPVRGKPAPGGTLEPAKSKPFDPEQLIF